MSTPQLKDLEGRPHFVIPAVMLTVGVHNGSNGPLYYPAAELKRAAHRWNGKPVVVYHPTAGPSGEPETFTKQRVGTVFNARFDGHKLHADAWIDVERVQLVSLDTALAIHNRRQLEISTGLESDTDWTPGSYGRAPYIGIAKNHHPDHLAVLPDQVGACSIAAGCGLMVTNGQPVETLELPELVW